MKRKKTTNRVTVVMALVFAILMSITGTMVAKDVTKVATAAEVTSGVTPDGIIWGGRGEVTETLTTGQKATVTLTESVIKIVVDSTNYPYYDTQVVGSVVIAKDDLLHIFWYSAQDSGNYYCMDLRNGNFIKAYKNKSNNKYCLKMNANSYEVKGTSVLNSINTAIIDKEYFYENHYMTTGNAKKERLITRLEFEKLWDGKDPSEEMDSTPTPVPTNIPTQEPTPTANVPTQEPTPTANVPTQEPTPTANVPTQEPTPTANVPTQKPTPTAPTGGSANSGSNNSQVDVPGNGNNVTVNQNITTTITNVNGDGNTVGVGTDVPKSTKKSTTTKKKKTSKKKKIKKHARVVTAGKRIKLYDKNGKQRGLIIFNKKKGTMNWNGYRMKHVKSVGFIQKSWNVVVTVTKGISWKLPKTVAKGKTVHKKRIKSEKAKTHNWDRYGFVKYLKLLCGGVKNISGL